MRNHLVLCASFAMTLPVAYAQDIPEADDESSSTVEVRTLSSGVDETILTIDMTPSDSEPLPEGDQEAVVPSPEELALDVVVSKEDPGVMLAPAYDLPVRHAVFPVFPQNLEVLFANKKIRCRARVWVDKAGAPERVAVVDCPKGLHLEVASALRSWRWERPDVTVPSGGLEVEAVVPIQRDVKRREGRMYHPGVTWLRNPRQITADPTSPALVASGTMPEYPQQVFHGDDICAVELTVTKGGGSKDVLIDECSSPYRFEMLKAVRKWSWYPAMEGGEPVSSTVSFDVVFKLEHAAAGPEEE
jgi:hypothetical protein